MNVSALFGCIVRHNAATSNKDEIVDSLEVEANLERRMQIDGGGGVRSPLQVAALVFGRDTLVSESAAIG